MFKPLSLRNYDFRMRMKGNNVISETFHVYFVMQKLACGVYSTYAKKSKIIQIAAGALKTQLDPT